MFCILHALVFIFICHWITVFNILFSIARAYAQPFEKGCIMSSVSLKLCRVKKESVISEEASLHIISHHKYANPPLGAQTE